MSINNVFEDEKSKIGQEIGVSNWMALEQDRIDQFADVTEDHQFIHVDPKAAAMGPFGETIAHGFLTLSMTARFAMDAFELLDGQRLFINYGFEKIRFLAPVRAGKRVRGRFVLADVKLRSGTQLLHTFDLTIEIEGEDKPALAAQWLSLAIFA